MIEKNPQSSLIESIRSGLTNMVRPLLDALKPASPDPNSISLVELIDRIEERLMKNPEVDGRIVRRKVKIIDTTPKGIK